MDDVGCYVAYPEVRHAILMVTALVVVAIFGMARWIHARRERRRFAYLVNAITPRRPSSAPFTVFYRMGSGDGGFICRSCGLHESGVFARISGAFSTAAQHLDRCRAALQSPFEGIAIVDGVRHPVVLRQGVMILAIDPVPSQPAPIGVRA